LTQTKAMYEKSFILGADSNNQVNMLNFYLECGASISVFLSGLLILTIEKDWWGGVLSSNEDAHFEPTSFIDAMHRRHQVYHLVKPNPGYRIENCLRLIIVGIAVSSFVVLSMIEFI